MNQKSRFHVPPTRLSRSSPGLIPPLVTLAAQREGREPTGRTRSESGREVSDRHAERRGGRRECKTEPHVVPLSLRFGSLRPLVLRVFRRHFIPPVFIILRTPRSGPVCDRREVTGEGRSTETGADKRKQTGRHGNRGWARLHVGFFVVTGPASVHPLLTSLSRSGSLRAAGGHE